MVLFERKNSQFVLHRIVKIKIGYYLVCGDNQKYLERVNKEQIIGKATGYYKKGRYVSITDDEYLNYLDSLNLKMSTRKILHTIDINHLAFLDLVRARIQNTKIDQTNYNFYEIYKIAKSYSLDAFIYKIIDKTTCPKEVYDEFKKAYDANIQKNFIVR